MQSPSITIQGQYSVLRIAAHLSASPRHNPVRVAILLHTRALIVKFQSQLLKKVTSGSQLCHHWYLKEQLHGPPVVLGGSSLRGFGTLPDEERMISPGLQTMYCLLATIWTRPSRGCLGHEKYSVWSFDSPNPIFWKLFPESRGSSQIPTLWNPKQSRTINHCSLDYRSIQKRNLPRMLARRVLHRAHRKQSFADQHSSINMGWTSPKPARCPFFETGVTAVI